MNKGVKKLLLVFILSLGSLMAFAGTEITLAYQNQPFVFWKLDDYPVKINSSVPASALIDFNFFFSDENPTIDVGINTGLCFGTGKTKLKLTIENESESEKIKYQVFDLNLGVAVRYNFNEMHSITALPRLVGVLGWYGESHYPNIGALGLGLDAMYNFWFLNTDTLSLGLSGGLGLTIPIIGFVDMGDMGEESHHGVEGKFSLGLSIEFGRNW